MNTHWKKLTNPNYLGSWDFMPGEKKTLTIDQVTQEEVIDVQQNSAKKEVVVAYFKEKGVKPLILNKTNCKAIQNIYKTPYIQEWSGKRISIHIEKVKAFGKLEDALRIVNERPGDISPVTQTAGQMFICEKCNKPIIGDTKFTAAKIVALSQEQFGEQLCLSCGKEKRKELEDVTTEQE